MPPPKLDGPPTEPGVYEYIHLWGIVFVAHVRLHGGALQATFPPGNVTPTPVDELPGAWYGPIDRPGVEAKP